MPPQPKGRGFTALFDNLLWLIDVGTALASCRKQTTTGRRLTARSRPDCDRWADFSNSLELWRLGKRDFVRMMTPPPGPPPASAAPFAAPLRIVAFALLIWATLFHPHDADAAIALKLLPDKDVKVQYTVIAPGRLPHDYDLSFSAESKRLRIDDPARGLWFLVDLANARVAMVVPAMRVVVTAPDIANLTAILQSAKAARFTPVGEATIAGLRCTRYLVLSKQVTGTTCVTHNGITLAVAGKDSQGSAQVVADSVTEATVPIGSLVPPPGFSTVALPRGTITALLGQ